MLNRRLSQGLGQRRFGQPKTDLERLKTHFGKNWKKHKVSELPRRGYRQQAFKRYLQRNT